MKKIILILILGLVFNIITVFGEQQSLGVYRKGMCINLQQECDNCSYVNLTKVTYPNSSFALVGQYEMTKTNNIFNYSFCDTNTTGQYIYSSCGDLDGSYVCQPVNFIVTHSGKIEQNDNARMVIIIVFSILILGGIFFTYYIETGLKFAFLLGTSLLSVFMLNLLANLVVDSNISDTVINLLWFGYRMALYIFYALCLFVLYKLTISLKIKRNPPPRMDSPLKIVRYNREQKYKDKQWH